MSDAPNQFNSAPRSKDPGGAFLGFTGSSPSHNSRAMQAGGNGGLYRSGDHSFLAEMVCHQVAATHFAAWIDLSNRAIEPNVFLDPAFVLPAIRHFALSRPPAFLLVWENAAGEPRKLLGLCPVLIPRRVFGATLARAWLHEHASVGAPLIDRARAVETMDFMLDWLCREHAHVTGLLFSKLRHNGPIMSLLEARAVITGCGVRLFDQHERAMLSRGIDGRTAVQTAFSSKKLKELRRLRRRLEDKGKLVYRSAGTCGEVYAAGERFLTLEAAGWKGQRGTALLSNQGVAAFTREMTSCLAREGKCRIDTIELDGRPVAICIILQSDGCAYLWKITYDERHAANSPGVQLLLDITKRQLADERVVFTDSCAIPDHPMIDRIWRDRLPVTDALIATHARATRKFFLAAAAERARRNLRALAKASFYRVTGRKKV